MFIFFPTLKQRVANERVSHTNYKYCCENMYTLNPSFSNLLNVFQCLIYSPLSSLKLCPNRLCFYSRKIGYGAPETPSEIPSVYTRRNMNFFLSINNLKDTFIQSLTVSNPSWDESRVPDSPLHTRGFI